MYAVCVLLLVQALSVITMLIMSLNNEASLLLDLLPNSDRFADTRQLRDDLCGPQDGLDQWVRSFLDNRHQHLITVERLVHLNKLLRDNHHCISSGTESLFHSYHYPCASIEGVHLIGAGAVCSKGVL